MNTLVWVVVLLLLGLAVMVLEVFVPSGGILGFVSVLALISAVATAFLEQGTTAGMVALAVVVLPDPSRRRHLRELIGRTGLTGSELLPFGSVAIDGEIVEAMSESGPLEAGVAIEVVGVQGTAIVVRGVERRETAAAVVRRQAREPSPPVAPVESSPAENQAAGGGSALSPTLENFEFDGLEPPAA